MPVNLARWPVKQIVRNGCSTLFAASPNFRHPAPPVASPERWHNWGVKRTEFTSASSFLANFTRLLLTAAVMPCTSSCAFWACTMPDCERTAKNSHPFAVQDCRTRANSTKTGCCYTYPAPVRSRRYWQKSVNDSFQPAENLPCWSFP